ncbi:MAG: 3-dehydroquinate synthase [Candidatus Berkiellales bacterium]
MTSSFNHASSSLWVNTPTGKYPILVGYHLLAQKELFEPIVAKKQVFILSHPEIASHYLPILSKACNLAGASSVEHLLIPSGDQYKTLLTAEQIWSALLKSNYHRDTVMIALGGGMIGDLAGFCAACFMRGVDVIQCPTSLLAQIDAAIGGKTGVNHPLGKNLIGAFHQPRAVITDLTTLATLDQREFVAGLGELIKYGMALDANLFVWLEQHLPAILARDPAILQQAVAWGCRIKAHVVSVDTFEHAGRIVLNFGHTIAHAIESLLDYQGCLHGEAVAIGMIIATRLSLQRGMIEQQLLDRLIILLKAAGLPTQLPEKMTTTAILARIKQDKKHIHQELQWVLLKNLGESQIVMGITPEEITTALVQSSAK